MLPRVLEPEVMDSAEEASDYDAMDHSHVNRLFVTDFLTIWKGANPILDVGTGTAQIPIELCRQAAVEQDPDRLLQLTRRINEILLAKEERLRQDRRGSSTSQSRQSSEPDQPGN